MMSALLISGMQGERRRHRHSQARRQRAQRPAGQVVEVGGRVIRVRWAHGNPATAASHPQQARGPKPEQLVVAAEPSLPGPLPCPPHPAWAWQGMGSGRGMEGQGQL